MPRASGSSPLRHQSRWSSVVRKGSLNEANRTATFSLVALGCLLAGRIVAPSHRLLTSIFFYFTSFSIYLLLMCVLYNHYLPSTHVANMRMCGQPR
ncbi:hypothetical protein GGI35DRAFT_438755 [Trichoderma velutinum]